MSSAFPKRPNDLLKHEVATWALNNGKDYYVLGGGYEGEDGIYRYKRAFAPEGLRPFRTWRAVIDDDAYAALVKASRTGGPVEEEPPGGFSPRTVRTPSHVEVPPRA